MYSAFIIRNLDLYSRTQECVFYYLILDNMNKFENLLTTLKNLKLHYLPSDAKYLIRLFLQIW
jgi:hypothetical protein